MYSEKTGPFDLLKSNFVWKDPLMPGDKLLNGATVIAIRYRLDEKYADVLADTGTRYVRWLLVRESGACINGTYYLSKSEAMQSF